MNNKRMRNNPTKRLHMNEKQKKQYKKLAMAALALLKFPLEKISSEYPVEKMTGEGDECMPIYVNEKQVSLITGKAISTLRNDRYLDRGIPYVKIWMAVRYELESIIDFMVIKKIKPNF